MVFIIILTNTLTMDEARRPIVYNPESFTMGLYMTKLEG